MSSTSLPTLHLPTPLNQHTAIDSLGNATGASHILGVTASADYAWRAPSPPHIHVPQAPDDKVLILSPYLNFHCKPEQKGVLVHITQGLANTASTKEWRYELRRVAQQMLRFLYLGPSSAARDVEALRKEGITLLLAIRDSQMAQARVLSGEKVAAQLGIEADAIDVAGNAELIAGFPQAIDRINRHLFEVFQYRVSNGMSPNDPGTVGKVLVFCESGNERSAAVVAAYLTHMYNIDEIAACQFLQTQRFCVAFDDAHKHLLRSYRELVLARESANTASSQDQLTALAAASRSKSKRGRDDMDDGMDVDAEQLDDEERFGKRSAFVPFRDHSDEREDRGRSTTR